MVFLILRDYGSYKTLVSQCISLRSFRCCLHFAFLDISYSCYLSPAPRSKGTKVIVSCFLDSSLPSKTEFLNISFNEARTSDDLGQIIPSPKTFSGQNRVFDVQFFPACTLS